MASFLSKALEIFSSSTTTTWDHISLKQAFHADDATKASAIRHILAQQVGGKDYSGFFSDVVKQISSHNFEIKKLVYLYLISNAKSQPDKIVLVAGSLVRDCTLHESPLVRGIAIRTLSSLQVPAILDFAHSVVLKGLADSDAYVRRCSCMAVVKVAAVSRAVTEAGLLHALIELVSDSVAAVVAAACCALVELARLAMKGSNSKGHETADPTIINTLASYRETLLNALAEATEWSQLYLLNALTAIFQPRENQDIQIEPAAAETMITRVSHLLASSNPAVVISTARLLTNLLLGFSPVMPGVKTPLNALQQSAFERSIGSKIAGPIVSICSGLRFEIRYVALRCIKALLHRFTAAFVPFIQQFFLKFDDPVYVKLEKCDILLALATRANAELVLSEFAEYSSEVDPEVVRKAVRSIGILAIRAPSVTPQCVERLVLLIESKVNFVVQEAAIVVQQILRQNPTAYEAVIGKLCGSLKVLDEPEAKAAVIWVIGEYGGKRIANATAVLQGAFIDNFTEETLLVQRAILTAAMKIFLTEPAGGEEKTKLVEEVLGLSTSTGASPDLRDRAFFYWRLLRADPAAARRVVLAEREKIIDPGFAIQDRVLLNAVLTDLGNVTSIRCQSARAIFGDGLGTKVHYDDADEEVEAPGTGDEEGESEGGKKKSSSSSSSSSEEKSRHADPSSSSSSSSSSVLTSSTSFESVLDPAQNSGLSVQAMWKPSSSSNNNNTPSLALRFALKSGFSSEVKSVKIDLLQLNGNALGIGLAKEFSQVIELKLGGGSDLATTELIVNTNPNNTRKPTTDVQVAIRSEPLGVVFFNAPRVPLDLCLLPNLPANYDSSSYARDFSQLNVAWSLPTTGNKSTKTTDRSVSSNNLQMHRLMLIHRNDQPPLTGMHVFASTGNGTKLFCEVTLENHNIVLLNVKSSEDTTLTTAFGEYVLKTITV